MVGWIERLALKYQLMFIFWTLLFLHLPPSPGTSLKDLLPHKPLLCSLLFLTCLFPFLYCDMLSHSVVSNSLPPQRTARLRYPWDSTGRNTGVGYHALPPGDPPDPGIETRSPTLQVDSFSCLSHPSFFKNQLKVFFHYKSLCIAFLLVVSIFTVHLWVPWWQ